MNIETRFHTRAEAVAYLVKRGWVTGNVGETFIHPQMGGNKRTIEFHGKCWKIVAG